jgi:hypothetical protein
MPPVKSKKNTLKFEKILKQISRKRNHFIYYTKLLLFYEHHHLEWWRVFNCIFFFKWLLSEIDKTQNFRQYLYLKKKNQKQVSKNLKINEYVPSCSFVINITQHQFCMFLSIFRFLSTFRVICLFSRGISNFRFIFFFCFWKTTIITINNHYSSW